MFDVGDLAAEIANELSDYTDEVIEQVNAISLTISKASVKVLKATSPKLSGDYAKAWRVKTIKFYGQPNKQIIFVKNPEHRLSHLLERSHATPSGGRTKPQPHIKPVEEALKKDFVKGVEKAIENI